MKRTIEQTVNNHSNQHSVIFPSPCLCRMLYVLFSFSSCHLFWLDSNDMYFLFRIVDIMMCLHSMIDVVTW